MRTAGLLVLATLVPIFAYAAELININTANALLLEELPGIGTVIAGRIIDYRETVGPFTTIKDIQKVSGIGSGSTYAKIAPLITVGDVSTSVVSDSGVGEIASSTTLDSSSSNTSSAAVNSLATYVSQSSTITLDAGSNRDATMEVPLHFSARAVLKGGVTDPSTQITWGFGDSSSAEGNSVEKTYRYAGKYLVMVTATNGIATGHDEFIVTVRPAQVRVLGIPGTGIMIANEANERLDLSDWTLLANSGSFRIPSGTSILPKTSVLFPAAITNLVTSLDVTLLYPNGVMAAQYISHPIGYNESPYQVLVATTTLTSAPTFDTQPFVPKTSSSNVQAVEPIISTKANVQIHEEEVIAPTETTEFAAVGATLSSPPLVSSSKAGGFFSSPWFLGLVGVIVLSGFVFILF